MISIDQHIYASVEQQAKFSQLKVRLLKAVIIALDNEAYWP